MRNAFRCLLQSAAAIAVLASPFVAEAATSNVPLTPTLADPAPPAAPNHPFFATLNATNTAASAGTAGTGSAIKLAITNIVLTNFDTSPQQVFVFAPIFASGGHCGDPVIGGSYPRMFVYVPAQQTLAIPYPTSLTFQGHTPNCIAAEVTSILHGGSVEVDVNGFTQ